MDLNLLTALDALLEENSVQAAADRLHLTPPAMSRTLARIRATTGDDILVRTGRTMTPTPRALAMRDEVRTLVSRANRVLAPARTVDPATLRRTFTIQGHDALLAALFPALLRTASAEAPGIGLRLLAEAPVDTPDLARGHVDLEVGATVPGSPEISHDVVGEDRLALVSRAGRALDLEEFAAAEHVIVSRRGRLRDAVDKALAELGMRRRVVAALPTAALALQAIAHSDVVGVMPVRATAQARADTELAATELPLDLPGASVVLSWHSRYDTDPAHEWLRGHCRTALAEVLAGPAPGELA
ncbi:LysR family transcriptional regulator [Amycolatopsis sp. NBRC 101858]|uniref:LysR family transcriptional regulator n=1 Tax=Amycolatopsis sp. NBRC 101858 TaxID=3032200 RepID=UPI002555A429|nr:LysR family transcriptional regulator [Amycolatopsis sp. NBRC 101858]